MPQSSISRGSVWMVALLTVPILVRCGSEDASPPPCEDWSNQASTGRRAAQDAAGRACSVDADCLIVDFELSCFADCGYPSAVAISAIPPLRAAIDHIDKDNCDRFAASNCPGPIIPPCVTSGVPSAVCRGGQCTLELTH
jgi:hypothetical protein